MLNIVCSAFLELIKHKRAVIIFNNIAVNSKGEENYFKDLHWVDKGQTFDASFAEEVRSYVVDFVSNVSPAFFDSRMDTENHVNSVCRSCYAQLRRIGHIRQYLTRDATKSLVNSLVTP